jgi:hypothetical protein
MPAKPPANGPLLSGSKGSIIRNLAMLLGAILFVANLSGCSNAREELENKLALACFNVRSSESIKWRQGLDERRAELMLEASSIFRDLGTTESAYNVYAEIAGMYSQTFAIPTSDRDKLLGFCASW